MPVETGGWRELVWGRNGLRSLAVAGGVMLHATNIFIVTTILPSVVADIGGLEYYAWNMTLFVVASILGSAFSAGAIEHFGLRRTFLGAIVVFVLGTLCCALAPAMFIMLAGRTVQGLGGGMLLSMSYSAVRVLFERHLWDRAMVLVSSMWGLSTLSGPAVGGLFAQSGHWRLAFWAVLPAALGLAWLVTAYVADTGKSAARPCRVGSPTGKILLMALSVLVVSVASVSPSYQINAAGILAGLALTILLMWLDQRAQVRLFPHGAYDFRQPLGSLYAAICLLSLGVTTEVYIPYFLQRIHGMGPLMAGYWAAFMSAGWTLGAFISSGRARPVVHALMLVGPAVSCAALAFLGVFMPTAGLGPAERMAALALPLVGVGLGVGLCWPNLLTRVFHAAPPGQENMASAAITTFQLYAMAMGAALAGMITNAAGLVQPGGVAGARQAAEALFLAFCAAPALVLWLGKAGRNFHTR
jgi:MFS family permease